MKYKVGDIIVSASSDAYVGEIIYISKEEDIVRHRCRKTGTEYEKSYFGFQCRYMSVEERLKKDEEFCRENIDMHQQLIALERERDEARRDLGEILAVIHRDGGHYTGEHGISKSVADAHATWAVMVRERDEARAEVEVLRRERDDLYGAVMLAEERGAEWAIRAKAQVVYSLAGDASYVMLAKEVCEQARGKR
jgi:hypothetical protein